MPESYPKSKIIFDVKCSQSLAQDIEAHGGTPVMAKTGHSYIKQKIQGVKAGLGGERSGHIFFVKDWYGPRGFSRQLVFD